MENLSAAWLYPIIIIAGVLQAWGPPMNNALKKALINPWLGSLVSFLPIVALLAVVWMCLPRPMPTAESVSQMPWWALLGGLVGAFAVVAGLMFVGKVGAGAFAGLTITVECSSGIGPSMQFEKLQNAPIDRSAAHDQPDENHAAEQERLRTGVPNRPQMRRHPECGHRHRE